MAESGYEPKFSGLGGQDRFTPNIRHSNGNFRFGPDFV
jgi:hypothetical protein